MRHVQGIYSDSTCHPSTAKDVLIWQLIANDAASMVAALQRSSFIIVTTPPLQSESKIDDRWNVRASMVRKRSGTVDKISFAILGDFGSTALHPSYSCWTSTATSSCPLNAPVGNRSAAACGMCNYKMDQTVRASR